jgi:cupin superfamily acireductone dioxygenase involved in methionine salvage
MADLAEIIDNIIDDHTVLPDAPAVVIAQQTAQPVVVPAENSTTVPTATLDDDAAFEAYAARFDQVAAQKEHLAREVIAIHTGADQDQRIAAMIRFIEGQQRLNDEMYDLCTEMNNMLGGK